MRVKLIIIIFILSGCTSDQKKSVDKVYKSETSETKSMASILKGLYESREPKIHYHLNGKLAELYKSKIAEAPANQKIPVWFKYSAELLRSGDSQQCINEVEGFLRTRKLNYQSLITKESHPIIELLALAYLRLGEVNNCQKNHNEHSCILPLREEAFHTEKGGSQKAIEIYTLLYNTLQKDEYKWLLNLAHMTLGQYPHNVPKDYFVQYPNWEMEAKDFPAFKEVAMGLGIAENGLSGGVCLDDFNNDGLIDIFMTSYGMNDQCKFYLNNGSGYIDKTAEANLNGIVSGLNCVHADYDNDGNKDIFIMRGGWLGEGGNHPNSLLKNNGNGTFSDVTQSSGLLSFHPTQTATWGDVNNDGYLDLFIGNESKQDQIHPCELYINQGNGKFLEKASDYNLGSIIGFVKGVAFGDINNDLSPDLYISLSGSKNLLFKNEGGKFKNISLSAGVEDPVFSFPCWFWDVNNDGYNDIFVSSYDTRNQQHVSDDFGKEIQGKEVRTDKCKLFINNGDETFSEKSVEYNLDKSIYAMGSNFGDLDNDGWVDFYLGTGAPSLNSVVPNRMFRNKNGTQFEEVTSSGRFGHIQKGHGVGFADIDNDGDQDVYAVMGGAFEGDVFTNVCFENPISDNNWVIIELQGVESNRSAIGSKLELELNNGRRIFHTISTGSSFGSNSLEAEIGIGKAKNVKSLKINWSGSGTVENYKNIEANKKYHILEGGDKLMEKAYNKLKFDLSNNSHHHH